MTTPLVTTPLVTTPLVTTAVARRDYNAPDPNPSALRYLRAAANTVVTAYFVWQQNWLTQRDYVMLTRRSWANAFSEGFEWDSDSLQTNFLGHPYNGSLYFQGARATGLSFWQAIPYTAGGSFLWEVFGETERPSMNDMFTTTFGGVILGEMLYRLSSEVLDDSKSGWERLGRELLGAAIAPMRGFDRLTTATAWNHGAAPLRRPFRVALNTGLERTNNIELSDIIPTTYSTRDPVNHAMLAALQIDYGDLMPNPRGTLDPFESFRLYMAANLSGRNGLQGMQIFGDGLLYGWSSWMTPDRGRHGDNNVIGFKATYDFQGTSPLNLSAIALGPSDTMVFRRANGHSFSCALDFQWVPMLGTTSAATAASGRDYNIAVGGVLGTSLTWDVGRYGRFGLRSRHYLGAVVSGEEGVEYTHYSRVSYEIDFIRNLLGVGLATTVVTRYGHYDRRDAFEGAFESSQLYLNLHN